jgi:AraC family transcriptional regulator of adaptative response / DNA-3-methyladenine glycosylase II
MAVMTLHDDAAYRVISARDARFDGRLFVGVTSTGIYCRPVCRVRLPRRENCRFFANAALAESNGFRPCLRCRPEMAPGLSLTDSSQVLAQQAALMLSQAAHDGLDPPLPEVAGRLGVTDRHLRRIFMQAHGVTPIDFLTTQRLLLAKQLLTDTPLPVTQVALASGYASLRRFNAAFVERYRMNPSALRREGKSDIGGTSDSVPTIRLAYRPPYDLPGVLAFFANRAIDGVESVEGLALRRTLALTHRGQDLAGWVQALFVPARHELHLSVAPSLVPALGAVVQRVRQCLDLDADPSQIDPVLGLVPGLLREGVRLPSGLDGFEIAVRVILGQQVTVAAARTLTRRLVERFGEPVATPFAALHRLFPSARTLAEADPEVIGKLGIVRQRVRALQALATEVAQGRLVLHRAAPLVATMEALQALPGIGPWSAQLIAMRALAWPDAWPASDIGILNALGTRDIKQATEQAEAWRPWRAYAVMKLWLGLEAGLVSAPVPVPGVAASQATPSDTTNLELT